MEIQYPVPCPLMGRKIDDDTCFDIHCVVEGGTPLYVAPKEIFQYKNYREICLACQYHRDD